MTKPLTYKDAGVDIEAGDEATRRIKKLVAGASTGRVLSEIGSFGGLFHILNLPEKDPVLVSSIDGVGTKMKIAAALGDYTTVGHDIVNHCVNDILVQGARPLFFLDYIGANKVIPDQVACIVEGLAEACRNHECALIGGETAEMPDVYSAGDIDLVGTIIGVVDRAKILDGSRVQSGDQLIGLASSGLHTNGYTLARKALYGEDSSLLHETPEGFAKPLGKTLLEPHRSYLKPVSSLLEKNVIHGMAHITGGGIVGNLSRVIPDGLVAQVDPHAWTRPAIFNQLAVKTAASEPELHRAFNMGIGMILSVSQSDLEPTLKYFQQQQLDAWRIGEAVSSNAPNAKVVLTF